MSQELLSRQNGDGGWSYRRGGSSWTEPTCYALLALAADGQARSEAAQRGVRLLAARQRSDGGWAPRTGVDQSTWVTALALLLPAELAQGFDRSRAETWLLDQTGRESGFIRQLRFKLLGVHTDVSEKFDGWPWYPGAAAWVTPTALSILALRKMQVQRNDARIVARLDQGRSFLMSRRCRDGGWNHGSTHAQGYDSDSYPETTGIAVLALHDSKDAGVTEATALAERQLETCKSLEAASWLTLGLLSRGRKPSAAELPSRGGTTEIAVQVLARAARDGRNVFLDS